MKIIFLTNYLLFIFTFFECNLEDGWEKLKVFNSTRNDAVKVLGNPVEESGGEARFETSDAFVRILYANLPCSDTDSITGGFDVLKGTIVHYQVLLKRKIALSDLEWDRDRYERFEDTHLRGVVHYYNRRDAIRIEARLSDDGKTEQASVLYFERTIEQESKFQCKVKKD